MLKCIANIIRKLAQRSRIKGFDDRRVLYVYTDDEVTDVYFDVGKGLQETAQYAEEYGYTMTCDPQTNTVYLR